MRGRLTPLDASSITGPREISTVVEASYSMASAGALSDGLSPGFCPKASAGTQHPTSTAILSICIREDCGPRSPKTPALMSGCTRANQAYPRRVKYWTTHIVSTLALSAATAAEAQDSRPFKQRPEATHQSYYGQINEPAWQTAPVATGMVERRPTLAPQHP